MFFRGFKGFSKGNQGNLKDFLESEEGRNLNEREKLELCVGILRGLHCLIVENSRPVVHRDLKLENILIHNNIPKIADFGKKKKKQTPSFLTFFSYFNFFKSFLSLF